MIIIPGTSLPALSNPGAAGDLKNGKQLIDANGNVLTGTMPTITLPTPGITVSSGGLITASYEANAGYTSGGSKSGTKQLTTQAGTTITPGTSQKTAVASGRYTTGPVYVAGDSDLKASNIKSGVNIFGVTGTLQSTEVITIELNSVNYRSYDGKYYVHRIYYDGTIPSAPSSGGEWEFVSFCIAASFEHNGMFIEAGPANSTNGVSIIFTGGDSWSMYEHGIITNITTSYFDFKMPSTVYQDYGRLSSIISGSHATFADRMIWPE